MKFKKLINGAALIIGLLLIAYSCTSRTSEISSSQTASPVTSSSLDFPVWQVKPGSVYDGDTFRVVNGSEEVKIRFACIDSPEIKQENGIEARDHLRSLLNQAGNQVKVNQTDTDRYGRAVASVVDG